MSTEAKQSKLNVLEKAIEGVAKPLVKFLTVVIPFL